MTAYFWKTFFLFVRIREYFSSTNYPRKISGSGMQERISDRILRIEDNLSGALSEITFDSLVKYVYNPLEYAKDCHVNFVRRYFDKSNGKILFLGMNPGPWGMCQNGIPFGERNAVRDWLVAEGRIERPRREHPKVKIEGFECRKSEDSGKRFWGLIRDISETPVNFFKNCLVYNYCPLAFLKESGGNITPTEIKGNKRELYKLCDKAVADIVTEIGTEIVIGIGRFAYERVTQALKHINKEDVKIYYMPHPSRRAGLTAEEWFQKAEQVLRSSGVYERVKKMSNEDWMRKALQYGEEALKRGEVPVGCLFIYENEIVANGSNTVNETKNATRHAEMNCIDAVLEWCSHHNQPYREVFPKIKIVVTVEPCIMCAAAVLELGVRDIAYGCANTRFGGCSSVLNVASVYGESGCSIQGGIFADEAIDLLKLFYKGENPNAPKSKVKKKRKD